MKLKIIVQEQSFHPHFDFPCEVSIKEFDINEGNEAEQYYTKMKSISKNSGGMMDVSIFIVNKL